MSGQSLQIELKEKQDLLEKALVAIRKRGKEFAEAEKLYRQGVAKRYLLEIDKGTPVTAIRDISRGDEKISELKFIRDVAETAYKSSLEAINVYKIAVRILASEIDREWNRSGN